MAKRKSFRKLTGILLCGAAAAGMIFSLLGLVQVWRYQPRVTADVNEILASLDQALNATQDGLVIVDQMLDSATENVTALQSGMEALAQGIHDSGPMLDSLASLTGEELPDALQATQTSLASAQKSAKLIDDTLGTLSKIPLLPIKSYQPDVPLATALGQVSDSLEALPESLATIESSLNDNQANLADMEAELDKVSKSIEGIDENLSAARDVVGQYQKATTRLKQRTEAAQESAPGRIRAAAWVLSFLLVWFLIAQLGLWVQGLDMWRAGK
jgi:chromosome segregation ATPase